MWNGEREWGHRISVWATWMVHFLVKKKRTKKNEQKKSQIRSFGSDKMRLHLFYCNAVSEVPILNDLFRSFPTILGMWIFVSKWAYTTTVGIKYQILIECKRSIDINCQGTIYVYVWCACVWKRALNHRFTIIGYTKKTFGFRFKAPKMLKFCFFLLLSFDR